MIHSQSYDSTDISKSRWNEFCNWCPVMERPRLLRRDREERQTKEVVQNSREGFDCVGLQLVMIAE